MLSTNPEDDSDDDEYQETNYTTNSVRSSSSSTIRSLYSPKSWPSGKNLATDSSAYPLLSTYENDANRENTIKATPTSSIPSSSEEKIIHVDPKKSTTNESTKIEQNNPMGYFKRNDIFQIDQCFDGDDQQSINSINNNIDDDELNSIEIQRPKSFESFHFDFNLSYIKDLIKLPANIEEYDKICFNENLIVSKRIKPISDNTFLKKYCTSCLDNDGGGGHVTKELLPIDELQEIGGMCLNVERNNEQSITIFKTSQFSYENQQGAIIQILAVIDKDFNLIEEKRIETLCKDMKKKEKSLHIFTKNDHFVAYRTEINDMVNENVKKEYRGEIKLNVTGNFLLDGGGLLLMRYLIAIEFIGEIEVYSMDISGKFCRSIYKCGEKQLIKINNKQLEVIQIVHSIIYDNDDDDNNNIMNENDIMISLFLPITGHLIYHSWSNSTYIIHINPLYSTIPPIENFQMNLHERWHKDYQLLAMYLNFKERRRNELKTYYCMHQDNDQQSNESNQNEIKTMIKDYVMCLVMQKPENVLSFTIDHFQNFTKYYDGDDDDGKFGNLNWESINIE